MPVNIFFISSAFNPITAGLRVLLLDLILPNEIKCLSEKSKSLSSNLYSPGSRYTGLVSDTADAAFRHCVSTPVNPNDFGSV